MRRFPYSLYIALERAGAGRLLFRTGRALAAAWVSAAPDFQLTLARGLCGAAGGENRGVSLLSSLGPFRCLQRLRVRLDDRLADDLSHRRFRRGFGDRRRGLPVSVPLSGSRQMRYAQYAPRLGIVEAMTRKPVLVFAGIWLLSNVLVLFGIGLPPGQSGSSIAWQAHLGGFVFGYLTFGLFDPPIRRL